MKAKSVFNWEGRRWFLFDFLNKFSECQTAMICSLIHSFIQQIFTKHGRVLSTEYPGDTAMSRTCPCWQRDARVMDKDEANKYISQIVTDCAGTRTEQDSLVEMMGGVRGEPRRGVEGSLSKMWYRAEN